MRAFLILSGILMIGMGIWLIISAVRTRSESPLMPLRAVLAEREEEMSPEAYKALDDAATAAAQYEQRSYDRSRSTRGTAGWILSLYGATQLLIGLSHRCQQTGRIATHSASGGSATVGPGTRP